MKEHEHVKIVYNDGNQTRVIKGILLESDDFSYKIKAHITNNEIVVGKSALIRMSRIGGGSND